MAAEIMDKHLNELVSRLQAAYRQGLRSVVLYGSAAAGQWHGGYSDLNVLAVLDRITPGELERAEKVFHWWRAMGNPAPLLLSVEELRSSSDCFPIEFHDIAERRRILYGDDLTAGLAIDDKYYRAQVEHELRAKMIRLRQKAGGVLHDSRLLLRLMCDSVATFCVLGRHALRLAGHEAPWNKDAVVVKLREAFGIPGQAFDMLLKLRQGGARPRGVDARKLFALYLEEISMLADSVDRLECRGDVP